MIVEVFRDGTRIFRGDIETTSAGHGWILNQASYAMARQGKPMETGDIFNLEDGTRWVKDFGSFSPKEE